jgi:uncharacterized membrane protein YbaN (DUF454 family)
VRERIRSHPVLHQLYRAGVFIAGLLCIVMGIALAVLPGPLTIPPVLLGLWIWSTEFRFAKRLLDRFKVKGRAAWAHAKAHPVSSSAITVGGLTAAVAVVWAVRHYELVVEAKDAVGL